MSYSNIALKTIYDRMPFKLKVLFTSFYGLQQRYKRYGKLYFEQVQLLNNSQCWSEKTLAEYQNNQLRGFIKKIYSKVPFYDKNADYSCLSNDHFDIRKLPVLSSKLVKKNPKEFFNLSTEKVIWGRTSGTTGSPMNFPINIDALQKSYAFQNMHYNWSGVCLHNRDKIAFFSGHPVTWHKRTEPPFWSYDFINNHLYFSSFHISKSNLQHYVRELEKFDPDLLNGYPSSVYLLALAFERYGIKKLNLKAIYTSSEMLMEFQRTKIESVFQVKVFNHYGNSEMCCKIVECEEGELHLKSEYSYIEILNNNNQPCKMEKMEELFLLISLILLFP
jgi:phenylacetate-CoA ligase